MSTLSAYLMVLIWYYEVTTLCHFCVKCVLTRTFYVLKKMEDGTKASVT